MIFVHIAVLFLSLDTVGENVVYYDTVALRYRDVGAERFKSGYHAHRRMTVAVSAAGYHGKRRGDRAQEVVG